MYIRNKDAELTGEVTMKVSIHIDTYMLTHVHTNKVNIKCSTFDRPPLLLEYMRLVTILLHWIPVILENIMTSTG